MIKSQLMQETPRNRPSLTEYLTWALNKPSNQRPQSLITELKRSPTRIGLKPVQMDLFTDTLRAYGILFDNQGVGGNLEGSQNRGTVLTIERYGDLAGLIYLGFDEMTLARDGKFRTTVGEHHPIVVATIRHARDRLTSESALRQQFPGLGDFLTDPLEPENPQRNLRFTKESFDPTEDMGRVTKSSLIATFGERAQAINSGPTVGEIIEKLREEHSL